MNIGEALLKVDKKYAWSLLGFFLAVIFGGVSIYTEFFRQIHPDLRFEIVSDASVLDVHEDVQKLEILYDGTDIAKTKQSLRVMVLRVINLGPSDILKNHYDDKSPLGYVVNGAKLLRAEILSTSSPYLTASVKVQQQPSGANVFDPMILEAGEWFTVKLLLLHSNDAKPSIQPIGKVAGVRSLDVVAKPVQARETGFWRESFNGGIWTQLVRLVGYFLGFLIMITAIAVPIGFTGSWLGKKKRTRHVNRFKTVTKLKLVEDDDYIFRGYVESNVMFLFVLRQAASDDKRLQARVEAHDRRRQEQTAVSDEVRAEDEHPGVVLHDDFKSYDYHLRLSGLRIEEMRMNHFIEKNNDKWVVNLDRKKTLTVFLEFLEITGVI